MSPLNLEIANAIVASAQEKARELGLKPVGVAVVDAGGHLVTFQRQDGAASLRLQIALGKACGALQLGVSSRKIGEMAVERPSFINAVAPLSTNGMIPAAGGLIAVGASGEILGAVGVSGDTSDNDEICALAGLSAAGLASLP